MHQDGSCNGLQHYAALGGDGAGAAAVNLAPRARPQDVYSEVAALVSVRIYRYLRYHYNVIFVVHLIRHECIYRVEETALLLRKQHIG